MQKDEHHLLAREGWPTLLVLALLCILGQIYIGVTALAVGLALLLLACFIFRNPARRIPSSPLAVVSPASGRLHSIDETENGYLAGRAIRFRVKIAPWDVHAIHCPVEGKVIKQWRSAVDIPEYNRSYSYLIKTDEGDDLVLSLLLGRWSPFTRMLIRSGERIGQGQACGFLYYSGMVEILMPHNSRITAEPGSYLTSGEDILGKFVHESGASVIAK